MAEETGKLYAQYLDEDDFEEEYILMKTKGKDLETAYQIAELIRANRPSARKALDILEDVKALLLNGIMV